MPLRVQSRTVDERREDMGLGCSARGKWLLCSQWEPSHAPVPGHVAQRWPDIGATNPLKAWGAGQSHSKQYAAASLQDKTKFPWLFKTQAKLEGFTQSPLLLGRPAVKSPGIVISCTRTMFSLPSSHTAAVAEHRRGGRTSSTRSY